MQRRNFLKSGAVAGITLSAMSLNSCAPASERAQPAPKAGDEFELNEATVDFLQQKMKSKAYTSHTITQLYITRVNSYR